MAGDKPKIYFDSCIFISMITGEQRPNNESAEVAGIIPILDKREIVPVTSVITRTEVLECTLTPQQTATMEALLRPPKVQLKDATRPIMDIAHEIRSYYQEMKSQGQTNLPTVETPDAIHLATAIYYDCPRLWTFDENDRESGGRPKRGMIPLSGNVAGKYPLIIEKPKVGNLGLPFDREIK